ncbi:P-loop containing nucleoside triphosphate hydrolase protein [Gymnopilus junonius]|uniref:P-loop containing nucleoside triphosphate hydrolase protein n=1 Tax=Gymnopilus junonius TaxID=109634 RepID=A0A9P5NZA1_GYMJU|nr:P-loop containing nucleoside triphosphate hydrolase protein [Gymnopilus junonius]
MSVYSTLTTEDSEILSIAVMGPTGTGKSSFINLLSGSNLQVGKELESCTNEVQTSEPFKLDGQMVSLIDTPGFDDTKHSRGKHLAGVIYMHRILDNRLGGISARNFRLFRSLCGENSLRNVVITTTMWDKVDETIGQDREKELMTKDIFFKPAIDKGARLMRHCNTLESARDVIRSIVQQNTQSVTLQIQEELGSGLDISETHAGKELSREIFEQMERHREEIRGLMLEIQEVSRVRDEESRRELMEERTKMERILIRLQIDSANLANGYKDALSKMEDRLRLAEASSNAVKQLESLSHPDGISKTLGGSETPGLQTHSPVVQAVAATENSNAVLEGKLAAACSHCRILGQAGRHACTLLFEPGDKAHLRIAGVGQILV